MEAIHHKEGVLLKMSALSVGVMVTGLENAHHQLVVIEVAIEIHLQCTLELENTMDTKIVMETVTVIATWMIIVMVDGVATKTALKVETSMKLVTCIQWRGMVDQETVW